MDTIISNLVTEVQKKSRLVLALIDMINEHKAGMNWNNREQVEEFETFHDMYYKAENQLRYLRNALVSVRQARGDKVIDVFYPEIF